MTSITAGRPLQVGDALMIPLVWQRSSSLTTRAGGWVYGERCAAAVAVRTADGTVRVLALDGRECDVEAVMAAFPRLADLLQ